MKTIEHTLTREQLYEKVWSTPILQLAKEFGMSDVGLAKVCRKHSIPRPPVGYWQKLKAGKKVRRPALPNPKPDEPTTVRMSGTFIEESDKIRQEEQLALFSEVRPLLEAETRPENKITVPRSLNSPDPLIVRTMADLKKEKYPRRYGRVEAGQEGTLDVRVKKELIERAMRILNTLLKALAQRGYKVSVKSSPNSTSINQIHILGQTVTFRLETKILRQENLPERSWSAYTFETSDWLMLKITNAPSGYTIQNTFLETEARPLEDQLNAFIVSVIKTAVAIPHEAKVQAEARAKWEAKWRQEQQELRAEQIEQARIEREKRRVQERFEKLIRQAGENRKAQDVRNFIEQVRVKWIATHGIVEPDSEVAKWIEWAEAQARSIDPLGEKWPWE